MATVPIFQNITVTQASQAANAIIETASSNNPNNPATSQVFQLNVTGAVGDSATVQVVGSSDGVNFANYGPTFSATVTGTGAAVTMQAGIIPYDFIGAYVTAKSGTRPSASLFMSA